MRCSKTYSHEVGTLSRASSRLAYNLFSEWRTNVAGIITFGILSKWRTPGAGVVTAGWVLDLDDFCSVIS